MSKNRILYIGNFLSGAGRTPAPNEIISNELEKEFQLIRCSDKQSLLWRMVDMIFCTLTAGVRRKTTIIIDVFSTMAFWYAYVICMLGRIMGLPVILVLHGGNLLERFNKNKLTSKQLMTKANAVISPSSFFVEPVKRQFDVHVKVIANPINIEAYPFLQKEYSTPHLLWVRSFHAQYNPLMAIELLHLLKSNYPNVTLTMIGPDKDGSMKKVRDRAIELGVSDHLSTPGIMSKEDWINASRECNVFINTTHYDNTPVSVIEALALGLPVVSTNVGGIPYLLKHENNALLVDDSDLKAMHASLLKVMTDSDLRTHLINNGRTLAEQMDIKAVSQAWSDLIQSLS
jgi:glycosyltransferase involved in cell wall biosynthesis